MKPAETGQVWEGSDGWVVLIIRADTHSTGSLHVHEVRTLVWPFNGGLRAFPEGMQRVNVVAEDTSMGGLAGAGWTRLA